MRRPVTVLLCCLFVLVVLVPPPAWAGEEEEAIRARVDVLLRAAGQDEDDDARAAAWVDLERLGWERVLPHIDLRRQKTRAAQDAALEFAREVGEGDGLYRVCLEAIRFGEDRDVVLSAIQILEDGLSGSGPDAKEGAKPRLHFSPMWWPDLLAELHKTKVVIIEGFYSGPGWPAANLTDLLTHQVHGQEAHLIRATRHKDWRVRMMAVPFLGATTTGRTSTVAAALRGLLRDPHPKVRQMTVRTICNGIWQACLSDVGARLVDPEEAPSVRIEAARGIWFMEMPKEARAFLLRAISHGPPAVRAAAAEAAPEVPNTPALARALLKALEDPESSVRAGAAKGLVRYEPEPYVPQEVGIDRAALVRLLDDPSPQVRYTACRILAQRSAVPPNLAAKLARRLTSRENLEAEGAAAALASLRTEALPVLGTMEDARGAFPVGVDVNVLSRAIESVKMSSLTGEEIDELSRSKDAAMRAFAAREVVRRKDVKRLLRALESADPEVALIAAWYLVDDPAHDEAVVDSILRIFPDLKGYLGYHVFHRMKERLEAYLPRILERYERTPNETWFRLLQAVHVTAPHLAEMTWAAFLAEPGANQAQRVARMGERLMPRVLKALASPDARIRRGAALVVAAMRTSLLYEHEVALRAVLQARPVKDPARDKLDSTLREKLREPEQPHHPWIELR